MADGSGSNQPSDKDQPSSSPSPFEPRSAGAVILIVEDNRADVFLVRQAITAAEIQVNLHVVEDGEEAIRFLNRAGDDRSLCPDLVLLDLNLPRRSGVDVLRHLRSASCCSHAPVIIVTSSDSHRDRSAVSALGAEAYFRKPSDYDEFLKLGDLVKETLANRPGA